MDEPAMLAIGQAVDVVVGEPVLEAGASGPAASWKGKIRVLGDNDDVVLEHFAEYLP